MADVATREFTIRRHFGASRRALYRAWTEPAHLTWFFNPDQRRPDEPIEVDLRVGGAWRLRMVLDEQTDYLTGVLVEQGVVSLDDDHLRPEWTDERANITVEQLLRMTSGLEWDETYDLGTPITRMLYLEPDMGAYVASLPLVHEPGTVQLYSR